jgi:hypothetical protein
MPKKDSISPEQITSESLFGEQGKEKKTDLTVNAKAANNSQDESICEVRLCTSGRLTAPAVLHFHDYNMMSAQLIAELPAQDNHMPTVVKILNSMIVEDFDCGKLHIEEIKEILLNVHAKWWGPVLQGFSYFLDPEIKDPEKLMAKENISQADIPIAKLTVVPLAEDIREPINIKSCGVEVNFLYPRAQNSGIVDECIKEKFAVQEQQFFKIKQLVDAKKIDEVTIADLRAYEEYLAERSAWKLLYTRAQTLCGVNHELLETLDDRVTALQTNKRISVRHWEKYNEFLSGKGAFGLKDEAEFYSDILDRKVKRPFRFRTYTLIPQVDGQRVDKDEVSFG